MIEDDGQTDDKNSLWQTNGAVSFADQLTVHTKADRDEGRIIVCCPRTYLLGA